MAINRWIGTDQNASWSTGANWSLGTVPGEDTGDDTEDVYVEDSSVDINLGLDNSAATYTIKSMHVSRTFTGTIGEVDTVGAIGDYLQLKATKVFVGELFSSGTAAGSGRVKLDMGTTASTIIVYHTATSKDANKPACRLLGVNIANKIAEIRKGSVGVASQTGEVSTFNDILISYDTSIGTDATLEIGSGVTLHTTSVIDCVGGETQLKCAAVTVNSNGGTLVTSGSGTITTLNVEGGEVQSASNGTITTCNLESGTADFTISAEARTVTTLNQNGGNLKYDAAFLTITNGPAPSETGRKQLRTSDV